MQISMITPLFLPVRGGTEVHVYNLSKQLVKNGDVVSVHTTRNIYTERWVLPRQEVIDGIYVVRHTFYWNSDDEILHLHNLGRMFSAWNLKTIIYLLSHKERVIFTPHHILTIDRGKLATKLLRGGMRGVFKIIAVSEWEKKEMIRRGFPEGKITVIPNGVEDEAYELPPQRMNSQRPYLLFLGRIYSAKNQVMAVRSLTYARDVDLVIAGQVHEMSYLEEIRRTAKEIGVEDRVKIMENVDQVTKYKLIDSSLAVVLTSEIEAEGLAIKEAMVRGKPVIVSNKAALPYLVSRENGFVITDESELAEAVSKLLHDDNLVAEISVNNRKRGEEWKWSAVASRVREVYLEFLNK
ncbi:glycosyl transferase [Sulfolobales archaeon HS-7]|nr:glycosyl transferase [Sulfolobales archaeon HS-7]